MTHHRSTTRRRHRTHLATFSAIAALTLTGCATAAATSATAKAPLGPTTAQTTPMATPTATAAATSVTSSTKSDPVARQRSTTYKGNVAKLLKRLPVQAEGGTPYDRDLYKHWSDLDRDGCDTRDEVGIAEATTVPTIGSDCSFTGGEWKSYYDGVTTTDYSTFDVDHLIPLGEAHPSGAWAWDATTREAFANDLDDKRSLVAVTASSNRSKSDRDPAEWLPAKAQCRYLAEWVAIKWRWNLTIDTAEQTALRGLATTCPTKRTKVTRAPIGLDTTSPTKSPTVIPTTGPTASPTTGPTNPGTPGDPSRITITQIVYDPITANTGTDAAEETLTLTNTSNGPVNLTGWTISDAAGATYTIPTFTLDAYDSVTLHSVTGTNTDTDLHIGWGAKWNNTGDTATLTDTSGTTIDTCAYTAGKTGTATC